MSIRVESYEYDGATALLNQLATVLAAVERNAVRLRVTRDVGPGTDRYVFDVDHGSQWETEPGSTAVVTDLPEAELTDDLTREFRMGQVKTVVAAQHEDESTILVLGKASGNFLLAEVTEEEAVDLVRVLLSAVRHIRRERGQGQGVGTATGDGSDG